MVELPNQNRLAVPVEKIRDYLLSESHPVGRFKANFFLRLGFRRENHLELIDAISLLARTHDAKSAEKNDFGQKYTVKGVIVGPNGQSAVLETVWIVLNSENHPRFVTAYPGD